MVEDSRAHSDVTTARNMPDAANSEQSLMGYAAINDANPDVAELAYRFFLEREAEGREGSADGDWFRAEGEVRRTRSALNA
jgi:hypothetical protein